MGKALVKTVIKVSVVQPATLCKIFEKFFHFNGYQSQCCWLASTIIVDLILQHCNSVMILFSVI
jgi:hypothetical protein